MLASLYDIAWLLNVRGNDISYVPVVLSYLALTQEQCIWFLQEEVVDDTLREYLQKNGITTRPYEAFYEYVKTLENQTILLNRAVVNTKICNNLPESAQMIDAEDPTLEMKAVKNETEISNTRKAHVKDAVAMCRFMYLPLIHISEPTRHAQIHVLAEEKCGENSNDGNFRIGLSGESSQRTGRPAGFEL